MALNHSFEFWAHGENLEFSKISQYSTMKILMVETTSDNSMLWEINDPISLKK